jgi:hypothetical protein
MLNQLFQPDSIDGIKDHYLADLTVNLKQDCLILINLQGKPCIVVYH